MKITLNLKCKAFSGERVKINRVNITDDKVRVYDSVAGYYTTLHLVSRKTVLAAIAKGGNE